MNPKQLRHLLFLAALALAAGAMLFQFANGSRSRGLTRPVQTSSPDILEAPPPPPSPYPAGTRLLDGSLESVRDLGGLKDVDAEPAYRKLAAYVATVVTDEGLAGSSEGSLQYGTFIKHAPELRGRIFTVRGIALRSPEIYRLGSPIAGREDFYSVYLVDNPNSSAGGGFICDLVDRPEATFDRQDEVEIHGIFYRVVSATTDLEKGKTRELPLFVGRSARKILPPPEDASGPLDFLRLRTLYDRIKLLIVIGVIGTAIAVYLVLRSMARDRRLAAARPSLRPKRIPGPGGKTPPPGNPGPPPPGIPPGPPKES